ncbi:hypothetical protein PIB30_102380 [Stylosanthes scabra]|uniref:Uncharacterized protein n=1 Tax=Stylosanthes scabra TaxID=79078 RepID=A0ABU6SZ96_9FABA|nr:hypothetical protein [Stylosanthes scabra]
MDGASGDLNRCRGDIFETQTNGIEAPLWIWKCLGGNATESRRSESLFNGGLRKRGLVVWYVLSDIRFEVVVVGST